MTSKQYSIHQKYGSICSKNTKDTHGNVSTRTGLWLPVAGGWREGQREEYNQSFMFY